MLRRKRREMAEAEWTGGESRGRRRGLELWPEVLLNRNFTEWPGPERFVAPESSILYVADCELTAHQVHMGRQAHAQLVVLRFAVRFLQWH